MPRLWRWLSSQEQERREQIAAGTRLGKFLAKTDVAEFCRVSFPTALPCANPAGCNYYMWWAGDFTYFCVSCMCLLHDEEEEERWRRESDAETVILKWIRSRDEKRRLRRSGRKR